jgi:hypothetical protein
LSDLVVTPLNPLAPFAATVTATLADDIGLGSKKNPGGTISYTAIISDSGADATGVTYTDVLDGNTTLVGGSLSVSPVTVNDSYTATGNVSISVPAVSGVTANDYFGLNPLATITASDTSSTQCPACGNVAVAADGSFTYTPPGNFSGTDTFTYTLSNSTGSSVSTVTITVSDRIMFVSATGAGSTCRPATPCTLTTADGIGLIGSGKDLVFVESGTYSSAAISLNSAQTVAGQKISIAQALTDAGITLAPNSQTLSFAASTVPVLNNAATVVTLNTNTLVEDLTINPSVGSGILGNAITSGTATVRDLTIGATGAANGVNLTSNTGGTFNFSNIGITGVSGSGFSATGGGAVNATQDNTTTVNTISTTTGVALNVTNTTIGASGMTFRSISVTGNNTSPSSGIILNNTGATGGLKVTGNGGACTPGTQTCTGGTIQGTGSHGVYLTSASTIEFNLFSIHNTGDHGLFGDGVNGFTLRDSIVFNFGNATPSSGATEDGLHFESTNTANTAAGHGLTGTVVIQRNTFGPDGHFSLTPFPPLPENDGITIRNHSDVNLSMTVIGTTFIQIGNDGLDAEVTDGTATISVDGSTADGANTFNQINGRAVNFGDPIDDTADRILDLTIKNNVFSNVGIAGRWFASARCTMNARFNNNNSGSNVVTNDAIRSESDASVPVVGHPATVNATITGNNMGGGSIFISNHRSAIANIAFNNNNNIGGTAAGVGGAGSTGVHTGMNVNSDRGSSIGIDIQGNSVTADGSNAQAQSALYIQTTNNGGGASTVCANIGGAGALKNTFTENPNPSGSLAVALDTVNGQGTISLEGWNGAGGSAGIQSFLATNNTLVGGIGDADNPSFVAAGGNCVTSTPIANPDGGDSAMETQASTTTPTDSGSVTSPSTFAWLRSVLHPVAAFAAKLNFLHSSEAVTAENSASTLNARGRKANAIGRPQKGVTPQSGETVGPISIGTLPIGKSVTIKYQAIVNTPPGAASVQTQGTVSGSNFVLVNGITTAAPNTDEPETGAVNDATKTNINTTLTWSGGTTVWETASNWDFNYIPQTYNDVVVPNVGAQPNIATSPTINSFNIANGKTLTLPGQTLTISGGAGSDLTLDGIISGGAVQFAGSGPHLLKNAGGTGSLTNGNLFTIPSPAAVTLQNNLQIAKLTINSGGSFDISNRTLSLSDNLINNGTFTLTGSTVIFNGSGAQTLTNTTAFNNLTINNSGGSVALGSNITVNGTLTLTSDLTTTNAFTLSQPLSSLTNGGADVVGNLTRTNGGVQFPPATNITFGNPNTLLNFTAAGTRPTSINFRLTETAPTDAATGGTNTGFPGAVKRTWLITPTGGSGFSGTMQLHYLIGDLNGNVETNPGPGSSVSLRLYKYVINNPGTGWQQQDFANNFANTTIDTSVAGNHFVKLVGVTGFSPWTIGGVSPTAATSTVSGRILDDAGNPVEGAVIRLQGTQNRKTITDSQGNYNFAEVETNGFYAVTPSRVNYNFAPATRGFSALGAHTEALFAGALNGNHLNPLDTTEYFVRQQYVDFLGREPEEKGLNDWTDTINNCTGDASCDRVHVSEMFFRSEEFQQRGYFVYRFYSTALGQKPDYASFAPDLGRVSGFLDATQLEAAKNQFASDFVSRPAFAPYATMTNAQYVDALSQTAGVTLSNGQALVASLEAGTLTRAQALRQIAESGDVYVKYYNQAFVVMEYFGYLRRDPDLLYLNWISVLDANPADSRHMVEGFVDATEYHNRFKQ